MPWFAAALDDAHPLLMLDDLKQDLDANQAQLWSGPNSAVYSRIVAYPGGARVFCAGPAGGDLNEILDAVPRLEDFARGAGCTQVHVTSSRAWARLLAPHGYKELYTLTRKIL